MHTIVIKLNEVTPAAMRKVESAIRKWLLTATRR